MLSEEGIEFIAKIGNLPEVKKHLEPDIMEPLVLDQWMVRRVVRTIELIKKVLNDDIPTPTG